MQVMLKNFKNDVKSYIDDDYAISDEVSKIISVVLVIVVLMAIGWFAWNLIGGKADTATQQAENSTNPGAGNEFNGNPFGN